MNSLKIKFFNNLLDFAKSDNEFFQNSGHKFLHEYKENFISSFMEYEIDGELLITKFWNGDHRGFLGCCVGLLGLMNRAYDELMIKVFLQSKVSRMDIIEAHEKYKIKISPDRIDWLTNEFEKKDLLIYGCRICLDCFKVRLSIESDNDRYYWHINSEHIYIFQKEQYESVLKSYRSKIQEGRFKEEEFMNLYRFL